MMLKLLPLLKAIDAMTPAEREAWARDYNRLSVALRPR